MCVSVDESHVLVGLETGGVVCVLQANNHQKFMADKISEFGITAVCCDTFDARGKKITVNKKRLLYRENALPYRLVDSL